MKLVVCSKSETPLYLQLYEQIVSEIINGNIAPNLCLPSIRFVARELEISVIPVKAAYEKLENDGYIYTVPGKGCFVATLECVQRKWNLAKEKLTDSLQYCKNLGLTKQEILQIVEDCTE